MGGQGGSDPLDLLRGGGVAWSSSSQTFWIYSSNVAPTWELLGGGGAKEKFLPPPLDFIFYMPLLETLKIRQFLGWIKSFALNIVYYNGLFNALASLFTVAGS